MTVASPVASRQPFLVWVGGVVLTTGWLLSGAGVLWPQWAQAAQAIYSCTDASGRRLTSDRPIPECLDREQRLLNKDGSSRNVMPPRMSPKERAAREEADRQKALADAAYKDAVRRDRNLMNRFPNEAAHRKAREAALDDVRGAIASSEKRIKDLQSERKPLEADAEFYKGKPLPYKLRASLADNTVSQDAQREIIENHRAEMGRINSLYDVELARLKKLWAGAAPGSAVDAPVTAPSPAAAATTSDAIRSK
jgi:hypothetical protein